MWSTQSSVSWTSTATGAPYGPAVADRDRQTVGLAPLRGAAEAVDYRANVCLDGPEQAALKRL
jgi:hypothetical protein